MSTEQRVWQKALRNEPLRVSYEVYAVLRLVCKSKGSVEPGLPRMTEDQLADEILLPALRERYPQIFEHRNQVAKMEKQLIQTLGGNGQ